MPYAIDTHCHINFMPKWKQPKVIDRALKANVRKIITIACNLEHVGECLPLTDQYDFIWTTAGIHPTDLAKNLERDLEQVYEYAKNEEKIVAIGEIGLDYYHDKFPHKDQIAYLLGQLNIAKQLKKPAILHCRAGKNVGENARAFEDMLDVLKEAHFKNAVMHCFSGNKEEARQFLDLGLMISFTGIITYDRNEEARRVVKITPIDRIMIETDSPFLTPKAYGRKYNEPAFVIEVAKTIAKVKGVSLDKILDITTKNAEQFFGI